MTVTVSMATKVAAKKYESDHFGANLRHLTEINIKTKQILKIF